MDSHDRRARQGHVPSFAAGPAAGHTDSNLMQHVADVQSTSQFPHVANDRYQGRSSISSVTSAGRGTNMPSYPYPGSPPYPDLSTGQAVQSTSLPFPQAATADYSATADINMRSQQQAPQHQTTHIPQQPAHHQSPQQHTAHQYHNIYSQQTSPSAPYDPVQQYAPRQSAAIEAMSTQFAGVPQSYFVAGEGGPPNAPAAGLAAQGVQQQYNPYASNQSPVARDALATNYGATISDASQSSTGAAQQNYNSQVGYAAPPPNLDRAVAQYEDALRRTHELIRDDDLAEAGSTLISLSEWLLSNAENLGTPNRVRAGSSNNWKAKIDAGLTRDDESAHGTRLKLWSDFNMCWLALLQRQKDLTAELISTGQQSSQTQRLLQYNQMDDMGKDLIRLCDNMEKHGLVDYQMGVWEEDIIGLLTQCLDLMEGQHRPVAAGASPSTSRRR